MKRYKDSLILKLINALIEYGLVILAYFAGGYIRVSIKPPYAMGFEFHTVIEYFPTEIIAGFILILLFAFMSDYSSVHYYNLPREILRVSLFSIIHGLLLSTLLFMLDGMIFSRLYIILIVFILDFLIILKRVIFNAYANYFRRRHLGSYQVLVIGNGEHAKRYINYMDSIKKTKYWFDVIGYLADKEDSGMENYLGGVDKLQKIINERKVDKVILAPSQYNRKELSEILSICGMQGVSTYIIPIFNDYISGGNFIRVGDNLKMFRLSAMMTNDILGVNIAVTNMDKAIQDIEDRLDDWRGEYICVSNVHTTVLAHEDLKYRHVQNGAVMALPDGGPLSTHSRSVGHKVAVRVTGPDLMKKILSLSAQKGWSHFFYGGTQNTLDMLEEILPARYPGVKIAGMISPPFRALEKEEDEEYIRIINEAKPDFVWVGLGAPKQECWMADHKGKINALMIGVGAAFDYEAGNILRAPKWMQKCNLEWLYRLFQDPKRLFKRYFITNIKYIWYMRGSK